MSIEDCTASECYSDANGCEDVCASCHVPSNSHPLIGAKNSTDNVTAEWVSVEGIDEANVMAGSIIMVEESVECHYGTDESLPDPECRCPLAAAGDVVGYMCTAIKGVSEEASVARLSAEADG